MWYNIYKNIWPAFTIPIFYSIKLTKNKTKTNKQKTAFQHFPLKCHVSKSKAYV